MASCNPPLGFIELTHETLDATGFMERLIARERMAVTVLPPGVAFRLLSPQSHVCCPTTWGDPHDAMCREYGILGGSVEDVVQVEDGVVYLVIGGDAVLMDPTTPIHDGVAGRPTGR